MVRDEFGAEALAALAEEGRALLLGEWMAQKTDPLLVPAAERESSSELAI
jgi:hypothetical protein